MTGCRSGARIPSQAWTLSDDTFTVRYSKLRRLDTSRFTWTLAR